MNQVVRALVWLGLSLAYIPVAGMLMIAVTIGYCAPEACRAHMEEAGRVALGLIVGFIALQAGLGWWTARGRPPKRKLDHPSA